MNREKWQVDRDKEFAEARIDLVEAMEGHRDEVIRYVLAEYLKKIAHEDASAAIENTAEGLGIDDE